MLDLKVPVDEALYLLKTTTTVLAYLIIGLLIPAMLCQHILPLIAWTISAKYLRLFPSDLQQILTVFNF